MEITPSDQMRLLNEARGLLPQDELEHRARQILDSYTPNQQPAPQTPGSRDSSSATSYARKDSSR